MSRLVFLLEEYSMKVLLEGLLPRLFPPLNFICVPHEGKQDLQKSIPRKLRAWREPGVRFVIVRDNDGADCRALRADLGQLCGDSGRADSVVRIACQELEAWYFGDLAALADAYRDPNLAGLGKKARFRDPDAVDRPSAALATLIPRFQKVSGARLMSQRLARDDNRSTSFNAFISSIERIALEIRDRQAAEGGD